ncbi:hypothetical protein [Bradyrhizobium genomosp. III]|uniref:hypothetical protein n=1 Tax=Bradyrhizobium genomosp. III TaxID=2683271 RepID=UPI0004BC9E0F|nr:hypothetical protein [Bradyrhizobium sp. CCBAU 15635]
MSFKIENIASAGNLEKERIIIKVDKAGDAGEYILLRAIADGKDGLAQSGHVSDGFWFPDESEVVEGDLIVLYTKEGRRSRKKLSEGKTAHFFYWGRSEPIWDDEKHAAVLMKGEDYQIFHGPGKWAAT